MRSQLQEDIFESQSSHEEDDPEDESEENAEDSV